MSAAAEGRNNAVAAAARALSVNRLAAPLLAQLLASADALGIAVERLDNGVTVVDAGIVDNAKIAEKAIPGCMLVCQTGKDMKAALSGYLQVLSDADASAVGGKLPADDFCYLE